MFFEEDYRNGLVPVTTNINRFLQTADAVDFQVRKLFGIARHIGFGDDGAFEAEFFCFFEPLLSACDRADFAAEADFAENHGFFGHGAVAEAGEHGEDDGEVGGGFADFDAADGVEEHVLVETGDAAVTVEDGEQHREAVLFETDGEAFGRKTVRVIDQCLNFDEKRAAAFLRDQNARTRGVVAVAGKEDGGWVGYAFKPFSVMANTPSSFAAPKRFLMARIMR